MVVFGAGDEGQNTENGTTQLYTDSGRTAGNEHGTPVAWTVIDKAGTNIGNLASAHARLPTIDEMDGSASVLKGKWLTVIALDSDDRIASFSNGCGDTKTWCLGAPGVDIYSAIPDNNDMDSADGMSNVDHYEARSGTAQAAAHVSGAIAVLKGAFPSLTQTQLVEIILATADDIGLPGVDDIYGHGALNLAAATDPMGSLLFTAASGTALEVGNQHR